ncbi:retropepsin-like aspartic protease [Chryseobacterium sp.]|uniref:retropepsin-like aspartic protease n=1 Tax=Chryseobacterium sp. TaxID=1871047 RepID=UPI0035B3061A
MKKKFVLIPLMLGIILNAQTSPNFKEKIDFRLAENSSHILIDVKIKEQKGTFVFDTGATTTLVDAGFAKSVGIEPNFQQKASGGGGSKVYDVALNQSFVVGNSKIDQAHFVLEDMTRMREKLGNIDGITGNNLIKKFITEIDFDQKSIFLYNNDEKLDVKDFKTIPFEFGNNIPIPQFDIKIRQGQKWYSGKILFDSGAGASLILNSPFEDKEKLMENSVKKIKSISNNLTGTTINTSFIIDEISIGDYSFPQVPIDLQNLLLFSYPYQKKYMHILLLFRIVKLP